MSTSMMDREIIKLPSSAILLSVGLHIAVPFLFMTLHYLDEKGLLPFQSKREAKHELYQNFIQVDVVALPDETLAEKKAIDMSLPIVEKPQALPEKIQAEKEDSMAVQDENKAKAEEAEKEKKDKLRVTEQNKALKRIKDEAEREAALKALTPTVGKAGRRRQSGNIASKGNSSTGAIGTPKDQYAARVAEAVKEHFNIYPWLKKRKLRALVQVELYPNGRVRARKIIKASTDPLYDSSLLEAIDQASPFDKPDDPSVLEGGIQFDMTPE